MTLKSHSKRNKSGRKQIKFIALYRKIHRITGLYLLLFLLVISITGLMLGWKKHSGGLLLPETKAGTSSNLSEWLPLDSLQNLAVKYLHDSISPALSSELDRIDIRPDKGLVKFIFKKHYTDLQLDAATGKLLHAGKRHSDMIENIHDGSILDKFAGTSNGQIKLFYTSTMGIALLLFALTGFLIWYGTGKKQKGIGRNLSK